MASLANFAAMPLTRGVNRRELSVELYRLYSGVVTWLSGHRSFPDTGRRCVGVGSHSARMSAGGLILAHSANVLTRLYRKVPEDSVSAYLPYVPWNQNMYAAMGTTTTTSSGWPTDLTRVA